MAITTPVYTTREDVKQALDVAETARADAQVDAVIQASARGVDGRMHRRFYPQAATHSWDWPNLQTGTAWRLWLDQHEVATVTELRSGGVVIPPTDFLLYPDGGPPYNRVEIDLASSAAFGGGSTHQRDIAITGVYCGAPVDEAAAGALAAGVDAAQTSVAVTDSAIVGVGQIIRVGAERMIVANKSMLDTSQNLGGNLDVDVADVTVPVGSGAAFAVGETILIDAERMYVVDVAGNNLIVKRAWDGSVLAAHSTGADVYAPRTLTVVRGALGTTAAAHDTAAAVVKFVPPPLIAELNLAEALNGLLQRLGGYARVTGSGDGEQNVPDGRGLRDIRWEAYTAHGRKARSRAV